MYYKPTALPYYMTVAQMQQAVDNLYSQCSSAFYIYLINSKRSFYCVTQNVIINSG